MRDKWKAQTEAVLIQNLLPESEARTPSVYLKEKTGSMKPKKKANKLG